MITRITETDEAANKIVGVEFKQLKTHPDDRGFFRELIRFNDPFFEQSPVGGETPRSFGQWSHSKMGQNTVKAWHYHHIQTDWWYCPIGLIHVVLYDNRSESPSYQRKIEFQLGGVENNAQVLSAVVKIPPGVCHGCRVMTDTAHLFYITSETYDPADEGRLSFNSPAVPHFWGDEESLIVAQNDMRDFIPTGARAPIA